jgi:hypothetical protein
MGKVRKRMKGKGEERGDGQVMNDDFAKEFKKNFRNGRAAPHTPGAFVRMCKERSCARGHS